MVLNGYGLAFVKKVPELVSYNEEKIEYKKNFHILSLGNLESEFDPYGLVQICIKNAFLPIFSHLKQVHNKEDTSAIKTPGD